MTRATIDLELMIHHETSAAVLVSDDGDVKRAVWLPKSACDFEEPIRLDHAQIVTVIADIAVEKGLI